MNLLKQSTFIDLPASVPGTQQRLALRCYGDPDARPRFWLQASLHADEIPGAAVLTQLEPLLAKAEAEGKLIGAVYVLPQANPIGAHQFIEAMHVGRYALGGGGNFNRHHPDVTSELAERIVNTLNDDLEHNRAVIRQAMAGIAEEKLSDSLLSPVEALRWTLFLHASQADGVLDLHCDDEACLHLYATSASAENAAVLHRYLGAQLTLLARVSGGNAFDEAYSLPWVDLAELFVNHPIPAPPLSATIEFRGAQDVSLEYAKADAANLYAYLQDVGVIEGDCGEQPKISGDARPLSGVDMIRAPIGGILFHTAEVGTTIAKGQSVGLIKDPVSGEEAKMFAGTEGVLFGRESRRWIRRGEIVCKVSGKEPLANKGANLLTD